MGGYGRQTVNEAPALLQSKIKISAAK